MIQLKITQEFSCSVGFVKRYAGGRYFQIYVQDDGGYENT
jgi:hypothetical protein